MIFDFIKEKRIIKMPHQERWNSMKKRLSDDQYQAIYDEINSKIDEIVDTDREVLTSSWIPGNRWIGTVYEPIDTICGGDRE